MSSSNSRKFSTKEISLLLLPILIAAVIGVALSKREKQTPTTFAAPENIASIQEAHWTPDGHIVALGLSARGTTGSPAYYLSWDRKSGDLATPIGLKAGIFRLAISADGTGVGFESYAGRSRSLNLYAMKNLASPLAQISPVPGSPLWEKNRLIFCEPQITVYDLAEAQFDASEGRRLRRFMPFEKTSRLVLSPDEKSALVWSYAQNVKLPPGKFGSGFTQIDPQLALIDWQNGRIIKRFPSDGWQNARYVNQGQDVLALAVTSAGSSQVAAQIAHFSLKSAQTDWTPLILPKAMSVSTIEGHFSPDGRLLLLRNPASDYEIYQVKTGQIVGHVQGAVGGGYQTSTPEFSPDGRYLLAIEGRNVKMVDLKEYYAPPKSQ